PSVTLINDIVSTRVSEIVSVLGNCMTVVFGAAILAISFMWFDPLGVIAYINDMSSYAIETGNFMYKQKLSTMDFHIVWFWAVWPLSGFTILVHGINRTIISLSKTKVGS